MAGRAVEGKPGVNPNDDCARSLDRDYPAWGVDLGFSAEIFMVKVLNRKGMMSV